MVSESSKIDSQMTGSTKLSFERKFSKYSAMMGSESVDKANKIFCPLCSNSYRIINEAFAVYTSFKANYIPKMLTKKKSDLLESLK